MAKPKYDIERFIDDVAALLKAKMQDKLNQINVEKATLGSTITLQDVPTESYYIHTWNDKILNEPLAMFIAIEDVEAEPHGSYTKESYKVAVEITMTRDPNETGNPMPSKLLRYSRALKEIFEENFKDMREPTLIKIETVRPISFKLDTNTDDEILVGGVSLALSLG